MCMKLATTVAFLAWLLLGACSPSQLEALPATVPTVPARDSTPSLPGIAQVPSEISSSASWIEVNLQKQTLILHEGSMPVREYPASTGVASDPKYATPPGLYRVQSKEKGPIENVPGVFVSDIIMFDIGNGNGIHSRPMDAQGGILDATLGKPMTAGCVRVADSSTVFEFSQIGMWVWIH